MKVLFFNSPPFFLAHGGMQTLTEALMRELAALGVEVEPERWWDDKQKGDIIHYFVRPTIVNVQAGHDKGYKMVMTENLTRTASRSRLQLFAQRSVIKLAQKAMPGGMLTKLGWDVYRELDAMIYVVENEWRAAQYLFNARPDRGYVIEHGLDSGDMTQLGKPQAPGDYLVSMATIHPRKNPLLLAQAARLAGVPVVFLGKPYTPDDPYFLEFNRCVDGQIVRYPGHVTGEEKNAWLRGARGFVLLSGEESGCIAVCEAAAARLPLLLSDLPWANEVYNHVPAARFVRLGSPEAVAPVLKDFYAQAHRLDEPTFALKTWRQVAERYLEIYQKLLKR